MHTPELWAALITPPGRGGIATILIHGDFWTLNSNLEIPLFQTKILIKQILPDLNRIIYGSYLGEDIVLCRTDHEKYELHCHGGPQAVNRILTSLQSLGFEKLDSKKLYTKSHDSLIKSEQAQALAAAITLTTADILLGQTPELWNHSLTQLQQLCESSNWEQATDFLNIALTHSKFGLHLTHPFEIAITGLPNAGKSSLLNAILGYERAIVYEEPGTTRDLVQATTAIHGWPFRFVDTAGLRETSHPLEQGGIQKARAAAASANLTILLLDLTKLDDPENLALLEQFPQALVIGNKLDLVTEHKAHTRLQCSISAKNKLHLDQLMNLIFNQLIPPQIPADQIIPFTPRQTTLLQQLSTTINNHSLQSNILPTITTLCQQILQ